MTRAYQRLIQLVTCALLGSLLALPASAQPALYVEGSHYTVLADTSLSRDQQASTVPLVTEIFWYGCNHCFAFEPVLNAWLEQKADSLEFSRVPTVWDANTGKHARLFAVTKTLGIQSQVHDQIFSEIHQKRNYLLDDQSQLAFLQSNGISSDAASKVFGSFGVDSQVRQAEALQREIRVPSIPAMIVHGKYMVNLSGPVATHEDMLQVVDYLLANKKPG